MAGVSDPWLSVFFKGLAAIQADKQAKFIKRTHDKIRGTIQLHSLCEATPDSLSQGDFHTPI